MSAYLLTFLIVKWDGIQCRSKQRSSVSHESFSQFPANLQEVSIFHTDRGKEFDNQIIDEALAAFQIERSLSTKGCPYDNAVAESTFKSFKTGVCE